MHPPMFCKEEDDPKIILVGQLGADRMSEESPSEKTVYFLGAGASNASDFGLPLMKGFLQKEVLFSEEYRPLCEFVVKNFPLVLKKKINMEEINLEDIDPKDVDLKGVSLEDVITYLELSIDKFGSFGKHLDSALLDARKQFSRLVQRQLRYPIEDDKDWCTSFKSIFEKLTEKDTIITLNYDLIVENTLNRIQAESGQGSKTEHQLCKKMRSFLCPQIYTSGEIPVYVKEKGWDSGWYLKLHGSISWVHCTNSNCLNHHIVNIVNSDPDREPLICQSCGSRIEWLIIPPTMNKVFSRYPKLGMVWSIAWQELTAAAKVVFIGVSFAPSDYLLCWLIKSSFLNPKSNKDSVAVVDKCPSVKKKIEEMVDIEPTHYSSIQEYIDKVIGKKIGGS